MKRSEAFHLKLLRKITYAGSGTFMTFTSENAEFFGMVSVNNELL